MDILFLQRKVPAFLDNRPVQLQPKNQSIQVIRVTAVLYNPMKAIVDKLRGPGLTNMA